MKLTGLLFDLSPDYVAGFFDGEGCVRIAEDKKELKSGIGIYFRLVVSISNTNRVILEKLLDAFGGSIHIANKSTKTSKTCYSWIVTTRQARNFLVYIAPYVFIKADEVHLVLNYYRGEMDQRVLKTELSRLKKVNQ